jgi:type I restriction enzyme R subunit
MPNQGTESQFEATTIDRLLALPRYRYQYGGDIERDWREVVMTDWLRAFLQKKYPRLPADALEEAIVKASHPEGVTTEQRNKNFHAMLTGGFEQKYRKPDGTETFEHIYVVEWAADKWADNDFCVVNQLTIRGQNDRRPDILIYLNGFPLVLFELKNPYEEDPLKIVLVRDMWLTGTDIPCLHTLYVDKPMKGHTLMQAIARVNRIFSNKPGGLVVDFIGIGDQLKEATKKYTQGGGAGNPAPDIGEEAKAVFLQTLADVQDLLPELPAGRSYGGWRKLPNIEFEDLFLRCCGHLTETDELRDDFLATEARLNSAFSLVNHLADCIGYADEVVFYQLLRKQLNKTTSGPTPKDEEKAKAVRELLDRSIESKGVVDIFAAAGIEKADISILDEEFLEEFKSHEQENLRLKLLAKILADEIRVREKMNLTKYRSFKEMLEQTLLKYHNRAIQAADVVRVMIDIRKDIDNEAARSKALNLSPEEIAFYDAVAANVATLFDEKTLCDLIRDVVQAVKKNLKVDWTKPHREDVKAGVRAAVKTVLRKRGVKKELLEALTDKVLVQAEALFKEWPLAA